MSGTGRWSFRLLLTVALLNLGYDLWAWNERESAVGNRRFFRGAEQAEDIDDGLAEVRIINATGCDYLIDAFLLDGRGGPMTHRPGHLRTLARAGQGRSSVLAERCLDRLLASGLRELSDRKAGIRRVVRVRVDRRRRTSCSVELRIADDTATASECRMLPRIQHNFRWLFGPPTHYDD